MYLNGRASLTIPASQRRPYCSFGSFVISANSLGYISLMFANAAGAGAGVAIVFVLIGIGIYFIPTIVASTRKVTNVGSVFVINLFLGWTLVGWAVALAMAVKTNMTQVHVVTSSVEPSPRQSTSTLESGRFPMPAMANPVADSLVQIPDGPEAAPTKWCDKCNKELRSGAKYCPECGSQAHEVNLYECVDCSASIALDDKFCPSCGSSVN
jgi:RNA polymerase subunit RPABC4/transcription elongation factor Spt4